MLKEWSSVMDSVMMMSLPWRSLRSKLVKADPDNDNIVYYHTMFDKFHLYHRYSGVSISLWITSPSFTPPSHVYV